MNADAKVENKFMELHKAGISWNEIGKMHNISGALAWRVAHGKTASRKARGAMGLKKEEVDRMAARLSVDEGKRARAMLAEGGYSSVTDFWREFIKLAD